jgi:tetrahydromethanopterin S-methyltransferase subunit F
MRIEDMYMIQYENKSNTDICDRLIDEIKRKNQNITTKKHVNDYLKSCNVDVIDEELRTTSKILGLGEFEAFMSFTHHDSNDDITTEFPFIPQMDPRKGKDIINMPSMCNISTIHSYSGMPPVLHLHTVCHKGYDIKQIANLVDKITKMNIKNTSE